MGTVMSIDITNPKEPKLNLCQAAKYFAPSRGSRPAHKSRLVRYITDGIIGPKGERVYLSALRQGKQWVTTPSAIQAFCEALTPNTRSVPASPRTRPDFKRGAERAGRELDEYGIKG
jgi:hypothetical protein